MKKFYIYSLLILSLWSCSDFLEQEPNLQISINEQLSNKNGVLQAVSGIYRDIEAQLSSKYSVYADALGGNITFTPKGAQNEVSTPGEIEQAYNFNATPFDLNFDGYYEAWYDIINQTNLILELINFSFLTPEENNQLKAELLTARALAHYQVALVFAQHFGFSANGEHLGVVYNTQTLVAGQDFPARQTMQQTYQLIQTDLNTALNLYTGSQILLGETSSYFNTITTKAIYARIALQMEDWINARDFANDVITESGIVLTTQSNYISEWEFPETPISETVLEFSAPRTSEGDVSSTIAEYFQYENNTNYADYSASGDILNLYSSEDIRSNLFIEVAINTNINGIISPESYSFTKKFQDKAGTLHIRLSEIHLIKAEANTKLDAPALALPDLNAVRTRANLPALLTTTNILEELFLERRRELAFEGHLLYDIARFQKNIIRNEGCTANVCNLNYPSSFYILPIPFESTELNENMQQNEDY